MKKSEVSDIFNIFMCCVGAIIGAGFASGQEIMSFFISYGKFGIYGMAICGVLFFAYIYFALVKIRLCKVNSITDYFKDITGKSVAYLIQAVAYGFMFASFCVMVAGSGAVAEQMFGANTLGVLFMAVLCFFVFLKGVSGMVAVNSFMTPVIMIGIIAVGIFAICFGEAEVFSQMSLFKRITDNFLASSIVYVSYNTVTLIGILIPLKSRVSSKKVAFWSGAFSGGVLAVMGIMLFLAIWVFRSETGGIDVPMLYIAGRGGNTMKWIYGLVLYLAMITTAVSSGFAFISLLQKYVPYGKIVLPTVLCAVSVPLAYVGFSNLVNKLYRFFGFLGAFVLVVVLLDGIRREIMTKNL